MKVFNAIFGIFAIFAAIYCICYPGVSFLSYGWVVAVLLGGWGLCAIFDYFAGRKKEKNEGEQKTENAKAVNGVLGLILGIAAAVMAIMAMFMPRMQLVLDIVIISMFTGWLIVNGCTSIMTALTVGRKLHTKTWGWTLAMGILVLLCGLYGIFHLFVMARTMGLMFGIVLMLYGVRLLGSVFEKA